MPKLRVRLTALLSLSSSLPLLSTMTHGVLHASSAIECCTEICWSQGAFPGCVYLPFLALSHLPSPNAQCVSGNLLQYVATRKLRTL